MKKMKKSVNFYHLALHGGRLHRMEFSGEDVLRGAGGGLFSYLAPVFDTEDLDSTYHRLVLEGNFTDCRYEILAAATNVDLGEELFAPDTTPAMQKEILREHSHVRRVNTQDLLLHELTGRYLWVWIGVTGSMADSSFTIKGFHMEFPAGSFVEYLPEVYQEPEDSFFSRYMAVLQSLYEDLEQKLDHIPEQLDYETTGQENQSLFAGWVGLEPGACSLTPEQRCYLLKNLQKFQSGKGTREVLRQVLELVTKRKVVILEYFKWHDWMQKGSLLLEQYEELYGKDASIFAVFIDCVGEHPDELPSRTALYRLIEEYMPLGMSCRLICLNDASNLDTNCYLDVNSRLAIPTLADTRGFALGGSQILG